MKITVRFAHLAERPDYCLGKKLKKGDKVGNMGNTGKASEEAHLHIDAIEGAIKTNWKLKNMEDGWPKPCPRQLNRFIVPALFKGSIRVTTPYADHSYQRRWKKVHLAYDVSTDESWPWEMFNPIEEELTCESLFYDDGYGWVVLFTYEPKE